MQPAIERARGQAWAEKCGVSAGRWNTLPVQLVTAAAQRHTHTIVAYPFAQERKTGGTFCSGASHEDGKRRAKTKIEYAKVGNAKERYVT